MPKKRNTARGRATHKGRRPPVPNGAALSELDELRTRSEQSSAIEAPTLSASSSTAGAYAPRSVLRSPSLGRSARRTSAPGLSTDYRYVLSDLKRIAILSAGTFVVLIALAFVIK